MRRRDLLAMGSAAGALSALGAGYCATAEGATSPIPPRSLRQLGGRQAWLPIGFRGRGVNGSAAYYDATDTSAMDQTAWWAPGFGSVTALRLVYAGFDMPQQGEVDRPVTATLTAAVSTPASPSFTVTALGTYAAGSSTLTFSSTAVGINGIAAGQVLTSSGGGIPAGTYVTGVASGFSSGAGNVPVSTVVSLSASVTAGLYNTQPLAFSGAMIPAFFDGARSVVISPAHDLVASAPIPVQLAAGSEFFVRTFASFSGPGMQLMDYPGAQTGSGTRLAGEWDNRSTSESDQTLAPTTLGNTGGGYFCPVAILGLVTLNPGVAQPGAVLIIGDSIAAGTGDNADAGGYGWMGYVQKSLGLTVPWIALTRGSTLAYGEAVQGRGQYAFSIDTGITDVFLELCRNDIESLQLSASVTETSVAQAASPYLAAGKRVWPFTCPPSTYSNDGWTTSVNQGFPAAAQVLSASVASGSTVITLTASAGILPGQLVSQGSILGTIVAGTTVSAVGTASNTVTLSVPTAGAIASGTKLYFGAASAVASGVETQRQAYNSFIRSSYQNLGLQSPVDIDAVVADASGRWRVFSSVVASTTVAVAGTIDGVHPSPPAHAAAVSAGIVPLSSILP